MVAFEVYLNGTLLCTVGIGDDGVLSVGVDWVGGKPPRPADGRLDFHIGGLISSKNQHVYWPSPQLVVGDEVKVKIVETNRISHMRAAHRRPRRKKVDVDADPPAPETSDA